MIRERRKEGAKKKKEGKPIRKERRKHLQQKQIKKYILSAV